MSKPEPYPDAGDLASHASTRPCLIAAINTHRTSAADPDSTWIPHEGIDRLLTLAMRCNLLDPGRRELLLRRLPPPIRHSLERSPSPDLQIKHDLSRLNEMPLLADGRIPLVAWLDEVISQTRSLAPSGEFVAIRSALASAHGPVDPLRVWRAFSVRAAVLAHDPSEDGEPSEGTFAELGAELLDGPPSYVHCGGTWRSAVDLLTHQDPSSPPRWLILAPAGAGKTTTAHQFVRRLAGEPAEAASTPLYVRAPEWARFEGDVFDLAEARLARAEGKASAEGVARRLRAAAGAPGGVWLVVDELDALTVPDAAQIRDRMGHLLRRRPRLSVVVFSRPCGAEFVLPDFGRVQLRPLDDVQQAELLEHLLPGRGGAALEAIRARPRLREAAENPSCSSPSPKS